jgi:hypothetical protein
MNEQTFTTISTTEQEASWERLFTIFRLAVLIAVSISVVLFVIVGLAAPELPILYFVSLGVAFILLLLLSLWLSRKGRKSLALNIYNVSMVSGLLGVIFFTNGVTGPMVMVLAVVPLQAGLLGGRTAAIRMSVSVALPYLGMMALEALGIVQPYELSGAALRLAFGGMFLTLIAVVALMASRFDAQWRRALSTAQQRSDELVEMSQRAEQAAQAERQTREREERTVRQLRQAVQEYTAFLERVAAGDYSTRLMPDETRQEEKPVELVLLGQQLDATVESLVQALSDLQMVQQRYAREAWESFAQARAAHRGFRYQTLSPDADEKAVVEPADEAWLTLMTKSAREKDIAASARELALPIKLRGEIIGAIGAQREDEAGWSDEAMALATAITDQLAQTIEGLRLLDETQRRAMREKMIGEATARMRETLDVETVLQTAVREMREALDLAEVEVGLGINP